jgi:hypothetical protein
VGDVWNLDDAAPAGPTLASHLLSRLGCHSRTDYVALPLTLLENWLELNANVQTYVRYISAALPRQACLSGRFSDAFAVVAVAFCSWNLAVYMGVSVSTIFVDETPVKGVPKELIAKACPCEWNSQRLLYMRN